MQENPGGDRPRPVLEELDRQPTRMGDVSLRRRLDPVLGHDVYEVKLGDEFLMSSAFDVAERELSRLGLAAAAAADAPLDVLVGGLGLGCTAAAALDDDRVGALHVVDALAPVISWHERRLLPAAEQLTSDPRCVLVEGDFFAWAAGAPLPAPALDRYHVVLVDIDHTPRHVLDASHAAFYEPAGLASLSARLHPGGVFALWSDEPPDDRFLAAARAVFASCEAHVVDFPNAYTGGTSSNTVYVAASG